MGIIINAVYENGVLRPARPLPLDEGQAVQVTVHDVAPYRGPELNLLPRTPEEAELLRRLEACQTLEEINEVAKDFPPDDGEYDILKALDDNRRWSGERPRFAAEEKEVP